MHRSEVALPEELAPLAAVTRKLQDLDRQRVDLILERDRLVVKYRAERWPWAVLQRATSLSRAMLDLIVRRARDLD